MDTLEFAVMPFKFRYFGPLSVQRTKIRNELVPGTVPQHHAFTIKHSRSKTQPRTDDDEHTMPKHGTVPNTMHSPSNTPGAKLNRGRMMMNTQCKHGPKANGLPSHAWLP